MQAVCTGRVCASQMLCERAPRRVPRGRLRASSQKQLRANCAGASSRWRWWWWRRRLAGWWRGATEQVAWHPHQTRRWEQLQHWVVILSTALACPAAALCVRARGACARARAPHCTVPMLGKQLRNCTSCTVANACWQRVPRAAPCHALSRTAAAAAGTTRSCRPREDAPCPSAPHHPHMPSPTRRPPRSRMPSPTHHTRRSRTRMWTCACSPRQPSSPATSLSLFPLPA